MKHPDNQFDDLRFDELLKQYGRAEPRDGLEGRVLARLATELAQPNRLTWRWHWVIAVLAVGAIAGMTMFIVWKPKAHNKIVTNEPSITTTKGPSVASTTITHGPLP